MFTRFTNLLDKLKVYGKKYSSGEQNMKILDALSKSWQTKALAKSWKSWQ